MLRVSRTKGIVPPSTKHGTKNLAPLAPWPPHRYLSKLGGGGGLGGVAYKDRARPPPPPGASASETRARCTLHDGMRPSLCAAALGDPGPQHSAINLHPTRGDCLPLSTYGLLFQGCAQYGSQSPAVYLRVNCILGLKSRAINRLIPGSCTQPGHMQKGLDRNATPIQAQGHIPLVWRPKEASHAHRFAADTRIFKQIWLRTRAHRKPAHCFSGLDRNNNPIDCR